MRWLDEKEAAAAPPLGSPKGPPPADAAQRSPGALVDGAPTRHQELAEARAAPSRQPRPSASSTSHLIFLFSHHSSRTNGGCQQRLSKHELCMECTFYD